MPPPPINPPQQIPAIPFATEEPEYWRIVKWVIAAWAAALVCRHMAYWPMLFSQLSTIGRSSTLMPHHYYQLGGAIVESLVAIPLAIVAACTDNRKVVRILACFMIGAFTVSIGLNQISQIVNSSKTNPLQFGLYALWQLISLIFMSMMPILIIVLTSPKRR